MITIVVLLVDRARRAIPSPPMISRKTRMMKTVLRLFLAIAPVHSARRSEAQNCTRGGSAIAARSATSKKSRSVKPSLLAKTLFGKTRILVFSSRTPPL